jgi:Fe-S-cluster containining protein
MNKAEESFILDALEDVYGVMRRVQANHDNSDVSKETRCIGSGNCCHIGLVIPLMECFNIAKNIRRDYWFKAETEGQEKADQWYAKRLDRLYAAFDDPDWRIDNETTSRRCAMWDSDIHGCSIYRYRPFICRAYGTITPVTFSCPRNRREDGTIIVFSGDEIDNTISRFEQILDKWNQVNEKDKYSVYMPLGVLKFLLPEKQFSEFVETVEDRFMKGHDGYPHQMRKRELEQEVVIS